MDEDEKNLAEEPEEEGFNPYEDPDVPPEEVEDTDYELDDPDSRYH